MKVLFNYNIPFSLAHGGAQIQVEQTSKALQALGFRSNRFYEVAPQLPAPAKPLGWPEVAAQIKQINATVLNTSR